MGCLHLKTKKFIFLRTYFTQQERYTYVDPDYSYSPEAQDRLNKHKEKYASYIHDQTKERKAKKKAR